MASSLFLDLNTMFSPLLLRSIRCNLLFAVCLLRPMNCGFMIQYYLWKIFDSSLNSFMYDWVIFASLFELSFLVWPTRLVVLAMGEVLSFGFNLAVSLLSDRKSCKARIVLLPSRITRWGFYHIAWIYPSTSCHLAYGVTLFLLNTLDACWIAVDEWSNSSRCR